MREFKFRAWAKKFKDFEEEMIYFPYQAITYENSLIFWDIKDTIYIDESVGNYELFVLMQYTGLKDKNGKEIYEGDILDAGDRIVEVVWHQLAGQWDTNFIRYNAKLRRNGLQNTEWRYRTEIIGNIYENPELLQVTK